MHAYPIRRILLAALLLGAAPLPAAEPPLSPGGLIASGSPARFSLRANDADAESLRINGRAHAGLVIVIPREDRFSVSFADLPAREGAARIGAALGGRVPLHLGWDEEFPASPRQPAITSHVEAYYLVRPGSRRQQLLDACTMESSGTGHRHLLALLEAEGAAIVPDAAAFARDPTRGTLERGAAIHLLGTLATPEAQAALIGILRDDPAPFPRGSAAFALGRCGGQKAVPELRRALGGTDVHVALCAAWALARLGDPAGVPLALAHLRDRTASNGLQALQALRETKDPAVAAQIEAALPDLHVYERSHARLAIAELRAAHLDEAGKTDAVARLLEDPDFEVRDRAADALVRLGTPAAQAALERASANPDRRLAAEAVRGATRLERSRAPLPQVTID